MLSVLTAGANMVDAEAAYLDARKVCNRAGIRAWHNPSDASALDAYQSAMEAETIALAAYTISVGALRTARRESRLQASKPLGIRA